MKTMIAGLLLAVVLAGSFGTSQAGAQGNTPPDKGFGVAADGLGLGRGPRSGNGLFGEGLLHDEMIAVLAGKLGLTEDALNARLDAGDTVADIASEKGLTVNEFRQMMVDARTEAVGLAVKNGTITQAQADWMKNRTDDGRGFGMGKGEGFFGEGPMHEEMITVLAGKLGLSVAELNTKLDTGATIAQLASDKGMTVVEFRQMMVDARNGSG